jgi:hypothetical protein
MSDTAEVAPLMNCLVMKRSMVRAPRSSLVHSNFALLAFKPRGLNAS